MAISATNGDAAVSADGGTAPARQTARPWHRLTEPLVMFPLIAMVLLTVLWGATVTLIDVEREDARQRARTSTLKMADTYEAQVVRALREIDHTLGLVTFMRERQQRDVALEELEHRGLLPPDLLFVVSLFDAGGALVASTRADAAPALEGAAVPDRDELVVGLPRHEADSGQWWLDFTRALASAPGDTAGFATVSVDAQYFVSGYETGTLGRRGTLGLLGTDGVFRVRRSGDDLFYSEAAAEAGPVQDPDVLEPVVHLRDSVWDGVSRYTSARGIFGFPLAVVVGLSEAEQHAAVEARVQTLVWRAVGASVLVVGLLALLGRLSYQLQKSRQMAMDEQVAHAQRVEYLAFHDGLTGLPNRSFFSKLLHQSMLEARRYDRPLALMFVDLDRFKLINDTLGHDAGDELLKEVATRLKSAVRDSDMVARLGGDEFVVLLPQAGSESQVTPIARKVLDAVRGKYVLSGHELRITMSVGIAICPRDGEDEETLMKHADVAMYHAKEEGKNNFQFYADSLNASSLERLTLESSLRSAVENGELRLYYQAKRDLKSGAITGVEALLRWQHPELGLVAPMQFIPLAEESGLIVPIGRWVLETACRQNTAWMQAGLPPVSMAVNLSARQFMDEALLEDIETALTRTGMPAELLELEITESMIMRDVPKALVILGGLKGMGVRIAIDDFGTGYSSLSALKQFPLDTIKIDGSFIDDVVSSTESKGLTEAIIAVGRTLSLTVIAEGVESREQVDYLREHACDEFQGFYLNRPMPADEFAALLAPGWERSPDRELRPSNGSRVCT